MSAIMLRVGTAGWSISSRYAGEFPEGDSHLARYARRLNAVEINTTFYRPHQRKTYERWAEAVPEGFSFAVKVPKAITHEARLKECGALIERFLGEAGGLGDKLGVLLVQLPPSLRFDSETAGRFFRELGGQSPCPIVAEPRHRSWFTPDVETWLAERRIARVAADPAPVPGAGEAGGWKGLVYYRWHGSPHIYHSDYDAAALTALRDRLEENRRHRAPAWCIFDNTASGAALGNALALHADLRPGANSV